MAATEKPVPTGEQSQTRTALWNTPLASRIIGGLVLLAIGGIAGVYYDEIAEKTVVRFQILSEIDTRKHLPKETDIRVLLLHDQFEDLQVVSIAVTNEGNGNLTQRITEKPADPRNPAIHIKIDGQILELTTELIGDDRSTRFGEPIPDGGPDATILPVLLMNEDAEARITLVLSGYDAASLKIEAHGESVKTKMGPKISYRAFANGLLSGVMVTASILAVFVGHRTIRQYRDAVAARAAFLSSKKIL